MTRTRRPTRSRTHSHREPLEARGARIPVLGMGTWKIRGEACRRAVGDALALGYRHLDTARMYENEADVGRALADADVAREEVFLTTKLWWEELEAPAVRAAAEESLARLRTDYVDLLLVHWPNPDVPLAETLAAMAELREAGRVRHLGVSNFPPSWLRAALEHASVVCDQVEYHPFLSQEKLLAEARMRDVALVAYSPLAHGEVLDDPALGAIARKHGCRPAQVALAWLLRQPGVAAVPKASSREHLEANLRALDVELDEEDVERIDALDRGRRTVDPDFAPAWER